MWREALIRTNNWITRHRRRNVDPGGLLLLVPHCLQQTDCEANIIHDVDHCRRCGQCNVTGLLGLRDKYGILCNLASGGRQALELVRQPRVRAVVAVACEKELMDGIRASFPKPVLAVANRRPHGPCRDACVELDDVEAAIREMLAGPDPSAGRSVSTS